MTIKILESKAMTKYRNNDITEYIKSTNISEARKRGVFVTEVDCRFASSETKDTICRNMEKWIRSNKVLLDEREDVETYTYGGASYNGRTLKGRRYKKNKFFSKFNIEFSTDDGYIESLKFRVASAYEIEKYKTHPNLNTKGVPDMLQIAYGLIKKYGAKEFKVTGFIHGENEPNDLERRIYNL